MCQRARERSTFPGGKRREGSVLLSAKGPGEFPVTGAKGLAPPPLAKRWVMVGLGGSPLPQQLHIVPRELSAINGCTDALVPAPTQAIVLIRLAQRTKILRTVFELG